MGRKRAKTKTPNLDFYSSWITWYSQGAKQGNKKTPGVSEVFLLLDIDLVLIMVAPRGVEPLSPP